MSMLVDVKSENPSEEMERSQETGAIVNMNARFF